MLERRYLTLIVIVATVSVVVIYTLSQIFDLIIALYTSVTTAIAITITFEIRHNHKRNIRYKNTVGVPALRKSLNDAFKSLYNIRRSIKGDMHYLVFNAQISNTLQRFHHVRSEVLRYSVNGILPDAMGTIIYNLELPLFLMQEETMDQKDARLRIVDESIELLYRALREFDNEYI